MLRESLLGNMFSNNRSRSAPKSTQFVSLVGPTQIVTTSYLEVDGSYLDSQGVAMFWLSPRKSPDTGRCWGDG